MRFIYEEIFGTPPCVISLRELEKCVRYTMTGKKVDSGTLMECQVSSHRPNHSFKFALCLAQLLFIYH